MKYIALTIFVLFACAAVGFGQEITDADRRGLDDLTPLAIDVDGDGKADVITPRVYQLATGRKKPARPRGVQNWIAFDLVTSRGRSVKSFFKYNYGDSEASYWVYALKAAGDLDGDGTTDLIFYSGDDTSDETVWLANKGGRFVELRRKISDNDEW